jgi:hypothetical protein
MHLLNFYLLSRDDYPFNKRAPESRFPKTNSTHFSIFHQFHHPNLSKTLQNTVHTIEIVFRYHILTRHRFSVMFQHTICSFVSQAKGFFSRTVFVFSELSWPETMSALSLLKYLVRNLCFNGLFSCIFVIYRPVNNHTSQKEAHLPQY